LSKEIALALIVLAIEDMSLDNLSRLTIVLLGFSNVIGNSFKDREAVYPLALDLLHAGEIAF